MTDLEQKKWKYRTDPEFRLRCLRKAAARHAELIADPLYSHSYTRLNYLRKKISKRRGQIEDHLVKASSFETDLFRLIAERDSLTAHLKTRLGRVA